MAFEGKTAFITGGATGIGNEIAGALVARGSNVVLAEIDDKAAQAAAEILGPDHAMAVHCNVRDEFQVDEAVRMAVDRFGGIDILVNNAGLHLTKYNRPFSVLPRSDLRDMFDVNVIGVVNCSLACRTSMAERGEGVIINIASNAAHSSHNPYGVSKLAVRGVTIATAIEFAPDNIRVNCVSPGLVTSEAAMADLPESLIENVVSRQLVKRLGKPTDIVATVLFLCSSEGGSFMTGETVRVCGGYPLQI